MAEDRRALEEFYRLYVKTSRKHGIPPQPARLFDVMWDVLETRSMMQLFLAIRDGLVINAMVCFRFARVVSAAYVGTDDRFLRYHPVKLTDWAAIEWACAGGHDSFDFLQSHVRNTGLRWYKQSFGAIEQPVSYHYYPRIGTTARLREALIGRRGVAARAARTLVRRLPTGALRLLGRAVFKHVG
jgi:lipid II:glycine glycyltransferase (peptidoglycan interpeptide bridge formation enzyme)